jgi:hypothetical protein
MFPTGEGIWDYQANKNIVAIHLFIGRSCDCHSWKCRIRCHIFFGVRELVLDGKPFISGILVSWKTNVHVHKNNLLIRL